MGAECMRGRGVIIESERTHTHTEREKAQVNVWNQADKAAFLFVISLLCTPPARPIYPVPLLLPNLFFHKCLLITFSFLVLSFSLSLSLSVNLFPSVSLRLSLSVSSLYSDSRAAVPHICSAAQRPQRQKDVCAYTCECYMAKSMWTLLVSGFFHNWGSTA